MKHKELAVVMREHIEACKSSGKSVPAYCKAHGIDEGKYYYWHKKLSMRPGTMVPPSFIPIAIRPGEKESEKRFIKIVFPNGVVVELNDNINTKVLKELICCI